MNAREKRNGESKHYLKITCIPSHHHHINFTLTGGQLNLSQSMASAKAVVVGGAGALGRSLVKTLMQAGVPTVSVVSDDDGYSG